MANPPPLTSSITINRTLIGVIAAVMLVGAGVFYSFGGSQNIWSGACLKVGMVMAALWLALPTITRRSDWGQASLGAVVGVIAVFLILTGKRVDFRIVLAMMVGVVVTTLILRPRSKSGPK